MTHCWHLNGDPSCGCWHEGIGELDATCQSCYEYQGETFELHHTNHRGVVIKENLCPKCLEDFCENVDPINLQEIINQGLEINKFFDQEDYCFNVVDDDGNELPKLKEIGNGEV